MATLKNLTINDTGFLKLPSGTTAQRPASPNTGMMRYNTDLGTSELYNGSLWIDPSTGQPVEGTIVTSDLRLHYDFGDRASFSANRTTVFDLSGYNNHGSLPLGGFTWSSNNGGYITYGSSSISTQKTASQLGMYDADYTAEAWVYPTDLASDRTLFGTLQTGVRVGLHLVFRSGTIYMGHFASDYGAGTVAVNNWYQIAYRFDKGASASGSATTFRNGVAQGTGTIDSFIGTDIIRLGSWAGTYLFSGSAAIYRIYSRALSDAEILQNFNAQRSRFAI